MLGLDANDPTQSSAGLGDMEFAPLIVFIESERFFLAANIFLMFPTGNEVEGLNAGVTETAELRFGVDLPLNHEDQQMEARYIFAFTWVH